jgi:dienelactone hydrolase
MFTPLLLTLFAQGLAAPQAARPSAPSVPQAPIDSITRYADPTEDPLELGFAPGASAAAPQGIVWMSPPPIGYQFGLRPTTVNMLLTGLDTGFDETFYLQLPLKQGVKSPLLMAFHKYGSGEIDIFQNTKFPFECAKRNWFMLASLGAAKINFSSVESQLNYDAVLDWVMANFGERIDTERIYGVGFSMGGGAALSYAARHQGPDDLQFAALVNHTGGVVLEHTWAKEVSAVHDAMIFWFGGSPFQKPFNFQRSSVLSFAPGTLTPVADQSMCTNIAHVPMLMMNADNDPISYLVEQTQIFFALMNSLGAPVSYFQVDGNTHTWSSLDAKLACDFMTGFTRPAPPLKGKALADRSGDWFWFDVKQDTTGKFTPFQWEIIPDWNLLAITETKNLQRIAIDLTASPLNPALGLTVQVSSKDFFADIIDLDGFLGMPSAVLRDTVPTSAWSYDPIKQRVTLFEQDTALHNWRILP